MKKLFAILLVTIMLLDHTLVCAANLEPQATTSNGQTATVGDVYVDLKDSMNFVSVTINALPDIDKAVVSSFSGKLANFMQYAEQIGSLTPEEANDLRKDALNQLIMQFSIFRYAMSLSRLMKDALMSQQVDLGRQPLY